MPRCLSCAMLRAIGHHSTGSWIVSRGRQSIGVMDSTRAARSMFAVLLGRQSMGSWVAPRWHESTGSWVLSAVLQAENIFRTYGFRCSLAALTIFLFFLPVTSTTSLGNNGEPRNEPRRIGDASDRRAINRRNAHE